MKRILNAAVILVFLMLFPAPAAYADAALPSKPEMIAASGWFLPLVLAIAVIAVVILIKVLRRKRK